MWQLILLKDLQIVQFIESVDVGLQLHYTYLPTYLLAK
jgi:hypothetical protein